VILFEQTLDNLWHSKHMNRIPSYCFFAIFFCSTVLLSGQDKARTEKKTVTAAKRTAVTLTVDQEDEALKFAAMHHPELAELLEMLRSKSRPGFHRGVRELHASILRLERFQEKQPARFDFELQNWKTDSRIRLLTARWVMTQDPDLEKEIRSLLSKRFQMKHDRLKTERQRLVERLTQLDKQIEDGNDDRENTLSIEWERLARKTSSSAKSGRQKTTSEDSRLKINKGASVKKPGDKT